MAKKWLVWVFAAIVLTAGIVMISLGSSYFAKYGPQETTSSENMEVSIDMDFYRIYYKRGEDVVLSAHLIRNTTGRQSLTAEVESAAECKSDATICKRFNFDANKAMQLEVKELASEHPEVTCYETTWTSDNAELEPADCFPMTDYWFGGAEMYFQDWPINSWKKHMSFYLSGDMYANDQEYGSVLERYWLSSRGVALYVPPEVPLHVSIEDGHICVKGSYSDVYSKSTSTNHMLRYILCFGQSPQQTHEYILQKYFARPSGLPDLRMMKSPIWSTWAQYKQEINQSVVLEYARQILEHNFSNCQLEIDDGYETRYGDFTFDEQKFPNAAEMIRTLHDLGFRVTTWVTPFVNPRSVNFDPGEAGNHFVLNGETESTGLTAWWNGVGATIDYTKKDSCDWYVDILEKVKSQYGVDSFKFDAGEINYITKIPSYKLGEEMDNLGRYTQFYAECATRLGTQIEVRASWNNQNLPIFVRMMDKDSNWSRAKGLKTLIPTALTFSLLGYPYVLPDMIGGNGYEAGFLETQLPERELFIRWLEITAFLPAMQFSFTPWQYDDVTVDVARKYVTLHEEVIFPEVKQASEDYVNGKSGLGPVRPIWWVTRDDVTAFRIDDEFMVGDVYLVAPVVENATRWRDVYLPGPKFRDGSRMIVWEDQLRGGDPVPGGTLLRDYRVELEEVSWWKLTLI